MKMLLSLVLAVISLSVTGQAKSTERDYLAEPHQFHTETTDPEESDVYWRTWRGKLPKDAVIGGYTQSDCGTNVPVYMGRALQTISPAAMCPVQIFSRSKFAKIPSAGKVIATKRGIQVMCARDASIVTWVAKNDTIKYNMTADQDCVISGTEQDNNTFFGKTKHDDNTVIGKALHHEKRMYFVDDEEAIWANDYEILCYTKAVLSRKSELLKPNEKKKLTDVQTDGVVTQETPKIDSTTPDPKTFLRWG